MTGRGQDRKYLPYAFTEQGVAMLSSVLRSRRAVMVNIEIMRAFVRLRQILGPHADLARKLVALERKYDSQFKAVFDAIRELMTPPPAKKRPIGFGLKRIVPAHCTGWRAVHALANVYRDDAPVPSAVGRRIAL